MASQLQENQLAAQENRQPENRSVGFDCEFVDPPPEHLLQTECPVCLLIIREPHQVTCCGYSFCYSCIERIKASNKPCPTCKTEFENYFPDKRLKRTLYAFKVYCSHKEDGCKWTGELGQLDAHLNENPQPEKQLEGCWFVEISCSYECGDKLQRQYVQNHQSKHCPKRPFSCEHCHNYESTYDDVIHNHWPVCGSFPLYCPNECGLFPQRQDIDNHVNNECPLTTINCDFVGCTMKLPRKDMPEHLRENLLTHVSLLVTSHAKQLAEHQSEITKLQTQIASLVAENETLKSRNTNLETNIGELQTKVAILQSAQQNTLSATVPSASVTPRTTVPLGPQSSL